MNLRLFVALPFSPEVCRVLLEAQESLRAQGARANFTRPENFHLTLAFLGETDRRRAAEEALRGLDAPSFPLTVGGSGRFGDLWWAGIRPQPALTALAGQLRSRLCAQGFAVENRPFRPHVTLARQLAAPAPPRLTIPDTAMQADRLILFHSHRIDGRLTYTPLTERRLTVK